MSVTEGVPVDGVTSQHTTIFIQRHCFMLVFSVMMVESFYVGEARSQWKGNEPQVRIERERKRRKDREREWRARQRHWELRPRYPLLRLLGCGPPSDKPSDWYWRRRTSQLGGAESEDADGPLASLRPRDKEEKKTTHRYLPLLQTTSSSYGSPSSVPFYLILQSCSSVHWW